MNFDEIMAYWEAERQQERDAATIKLKQMLVDRPDIAKISITYEGYGDSGCFDARSYSDSQGNDVEADFLNDAVEEYVCSILPGGWEINDGSYGEVEIDVATGKSKVLHTERIVNEITTEFEVQNGPPISPRS
jgi:hypothetical protein